MASQLVINGISTDSEVEKIRIRWPDQTLRPGVRISYTQMAACLGLEPDDVRFRTVTNSWRRAVRRESSVFIECARGEGFVVLDDGGKLGRSVRYGKKSLRSAKESFVVAAHVDVSKLDESQRAVHGHIQRRASAIMAIGQIRRTANLPKMN